MESPLIRFKNVTKRFDDRTVLDHVNLTIDEGRITTIIGKSGVGKTVLLKHIVGLLKPDQGTILFHGKDIHKLTGGEWQAYLSQISYLFQNNALFDSHTVLENIAFPLRYTTNLNKTEIESRAMEMIEQADLLEVAHKYPAELSGGMQKRAALSRALVTDPKVVLFDEPTTGQDPIRKNAILNLIVEYQEKYGFTAIIISHDIPDVLYISDHVVALSNGKLVFHEVAEKLKKLGHRFPDKTGWGFENIEDYIAQMYPS